MEGQEGHLHTSVVQARRHLANLGSTAPPFVIAPSLGSVCTITTCSMALNLSLLSISLPHLLGPFTSTMVLASIPEKKAPVVMRAPWGRERKAVQALR